MTLRYPHEGPRVVWVRDGNPGRACMNRDLNQNLSGHQVYYRACCLLVTLKNTCSKLHCQKGFDFILFSYTGVHHWCRRVPSPHRGGFSVEADAVSATSPHNKTKSTNLSSKLYLDNPPKTDGCQGESEIWDWWLWSDREGWWCGRGRGSSSTDRRRSTSSASARCDGASHSNFSSAL